MHMPLHRELCILPCGNCFYNCTVRNIGRIIHLAAHDDAVIISFVSCIIRVNTHGFVVAFILNGLIDAFPIKAIPQTADHITHIRRRIVRACCQTDDRSFLQIDNFVLHMTYLTLF